MTLPTAQKPILFYASRCGKCRVLSQIVVSASLHQIERTPIESDTAEELYQTHPEARQKLVLFHPAFTEGKLAIGAWVYAAVPWTICKIWGAIVLTKLRTSHPSKI